jgi:Protein of unknown function (DUF3043)
VTSLFSRKPAATDTAVDKADEDAAVSSTRTRGYTPSKKELGKATPKRKGGVKSEPPPANRKEAQKRSRDKQRVARVESRAGMMAGKEEYLLARDKGPDRRLVRDVVDSRRNLASYFIPAAAVFFLGSSTAMPPIVRTVANTLSILMVLALIVDSYLLTRKVGATLRAKAPKASRPPRSNYYYAILRSMSFRRMRMPAPQVKVGDVV